MDNNTDHIRLAVIMACHNRRHSTLSCLSALQNQKLDPSVIVDVFLLDDGSTDGTSKAVRERFPDVHLLAGDGTLFWNRGMHKAFAAAIDKGFDYYVWLNDDSILYENALDALLSTSHKLRSQGYDNAIVGSAMQDADNGEFTYGGFRRYRAGWGRVKHARVYPADTPLQCDCSNGNCVLIPAGVVNQLGNLDPTYLHRWGDHDYCFRALDKGFTVWIAPGYLGRCSSNSIEGTWEDVNLPMRERFKKLNSPRGYQFKDYAVYLKRHRGPWWMGHLLWPYAKIVLQTTKRKVSTLRGI